MVLGLAGAGVLLWHDRNEVIAVVGTIVVAVVTVAVSLRRARTKTEPVYPQNAKYYSRTQYLLIYGPLPCSIFAGGLVPYLMGARSYDPILAAAFSLFFLLSLVWIFVGRALTNRAYESGTPRFLGIDISKNLQPSQAERLGIKFNYAASAAIGLAVATDTFADLKVKGLALAVGGAVIFGGAFGLSFFSLTTIEMVISGFRFRPVRDRAPRYTDYERPFGQR
jgi:hypothetical protein